MKTKLILLALLFLTGCTTVNTELYRTLEPPIEKANKVSHMGFALKSLEDPSITYDYNPHQLLLPASIQKILTSLFALQELGPDFTFKTSLFKDSKTNKIYLSLSSDPDFTSKDLERLFASLKISKPYEALILIDPWPMLSEWCPYWMIEDMQYANPLGGGILDRNEFKVSFSLRKAQLHTYTMAPFKIISSLKLDENQETDLTWHWEEETLFINGTLKKESLNKEFSIPVYSSRKFLPLKIKSIAAKKGLQFKGDIHYGKLPDHAELLAIHESKPLSFYLSQALKKSDNLYADALFLTTAHQIDPALSSWQEAGNILKERLTSYTAVDLSKAQVLDGSGLSRKNYISPAHLTNLLAHAKDNRLFLDALPSQNEKKSSLSGRFKDFPALIKAKTGTLNGFSSLAGYLTIDNKVYAFTSILINDFSSSKERRAFEESLLTQAAQVLQN